MILNDIDIEFRRNTGETDPAGRWSYADVAGWINEARNFLALLLRWPDWTWTNTLSGGTGIGVAEIQMPETIQIDRVYVNGQPIVPTSIPALEGTDIEYYDMSVGNLPQWNQQPYASFPVQSGQQGYPQGLGPFYVGQRPRYYMRGGNLGLVPSPSGSFTLQVDGVGVPPPLVNQNDIDIFPSFAKYTIAHKAAELAFLADKNPDSAQAQAMEYKANEKELITWRRSLVKNLPRGPRVIGYRHFWSRGSLIGR